MKALWLDAEWKPRPEYKLNERERTTRRAYRGNQVYYDPKLYMTDIPAPEPSPDEVLVKVKACGVCGSDVHFLEKEPNGYTMYPGHCKLPMVIGHEWSGVVEEVGSKVTALKPRDRVCVEEMIWCGVCTPCRMGMVNQCEDLEEIGFTVNGAFAEYVVTKPQYCWKIDSILEAYDGDEDKAFEVGAMVEPCGVAYNAMFVRGGGIQPGGHVAVFGSGPIGLASIGLARTSGAAKIFSFEVVPERRELAKKMGADYVFDPVQLQEEGTDVGEMLRDITDGVGIAMSVEAAGVSPKTFPIIEQALAVKGKVIQVGMGSERTPVLLVQFQYQGASIHASVGHSGHDIFPSVIRLMAAKRLDMLPIVTARFPLDEALEAIELTSRRVDGKVMVKP
ncbi:MAG: scyllo-inosose 3-dehydrogenase [Chloroflexota bacterium]